MKLKFIYVFSFLLTAFLITVNQSSVYTRSAGTIVAKTGAPGDNLCSQCHGGSASGGTGSVTVSIEGNPTEYVPGNVYSITVDVVDPVANEHGFQMTCINGTLSSSDSPSTGGFSAVTGTWLQNSGGRQYITHNTPSSTGSWTFNWTAPNPADGDLHFYIASLGTNNNNSTSGDKLYTTTFTLNAPAAACAISNLTTTAQACDENGNFDVIIDFDVSDAGANNTFTIEGNSTNYGTFNYNDIPIILTDLDGDNTTNYEFTITDTNDSNCTASNTLGTVDCPDCVISNLTATAQACEIDGTFDVVIDFNVANGGANNTFTIEGNSTNYGIFNYNDIPITLTDLDGDNTTNYEFTVTDTNLSNCEANVNLGAVDCPVCSITNLSATAQACEVDGSFDVVIDFDIEDAGGTTFSIKGNGNTYGLFSYASLPVTVVDLQGDNSTDFEFIITDNNTASCTASTNIGLIDCPVCSINDLVVTQEDCETDGTFSAVIDFNVVNPVSSSFTIVGNGIDYGAFQYANLPITIANLEGDNSTVYEFVVTDSDLPDCSNVEEFQVVACPVCSISDLVVTQGDCQTDGTYSVLIDFSVMNPVSSSFTITGNGENYGSFNYNDIPITIDNLVGDNTMAYEFVVTDNDFLDCSAAEELGVVDCPVCSISDLVVTQGDCQTDGTFSVLIDFSVMNPVSSSFTITGNGENYGSFNYNDIPITIDNLVGDNTTAYEFVVTDNDFLDCSAAEELGVVDCPVCSISDLVVTQGDCQTDGTFSVLIDFSVTNPVSSSFTITGNGENYGSFNYNDIPITIDNLVGDNTTAYEFVVTDNDFLDCSAADELGVVDCPVCNIFDIVVDLGDCNDDGTYSLTLNFEHENTINDSFDVHFGEVFIGFFAYADLPITIESFPTDGGPNDSITISDNDNSECTATLEFAALDCPVAECEIGELNVTVLDCNEDGTFAVSINFEFAEVGDEGFRVQGNGTNYGNFEYADLPIVIEGLNGDNDTEYEFVVIDNQIEGCAADIGIGTVNCEVIEECNIFDIVVDLGDCNDDGTYSLTLNFEHENTINDSFDVHFGEVFIGFFAYADLPITIESFPTNGGPNDSITISDHDNPECAATLEFAALDCPVAECEIGELNVTVLDCNEDGTFAVSINFEFAEVGDEGFRVQGNGTNYGNFEYADLPIVIEGLNGDNDTEYEFVVIDNQIEGCAADIGIGTVDCGVTGDCSITEVFAEAGECNGDGNFFVDIEFDAAFGSEQGFTIVGNGMNYGSFQYGQTFYTIGPLAGDGETIYEFIIRDIEDESCSGVFVFEEPIDCGGGGECGFTEVSVEVGDCNEDGTYSLVLSFEPIDVTNDFFDLRFGEISLGFFAYADLPITIESFPTDGGPNDSITISDNDNADCSVTFEFEAPDCTTVNCEIGGLEVTVLECDEEGNFAVSINFDFDNVGDEGFRVQGNGTNYGDFEYFNLPIVIDGLVGNGETIYEFVVMDNQIEGCSVATDIGAIVCETQDCVISNVIVEAHECNETGSFLVDIAFNVENPTAQSFTIVGNGNNYGTFNYGAPFYTIGPLEGDGVTVYEFIVTDTENADCSAFVGLDPIDCNPANCAISGLELVTGDCADDGTFNLTVNFEIEDGGEAGFELLINGDSFGEFAYEDLPLTIAELDANAVELYNFEVVDLVFEDCRAMEMLISPDCPVLLCTADAGTMPTEMVMVCDEDTAPIATEGAILENDDVLAYILHTGSGEELGDIVEIFLSPQVDNLNLGANRNTVYYFSAVAGPEGDTDDNFPDLSSDCTKIAAGTPVVFLQPIEILIDENCNTETGIFEAAFFVNGGLPSYDELATYAITIAADGVENVEGEINEIFTFSGLQNGDVYVLNATDGNGCTANFVSEPILCDTGVGINNQIPINFSLQELSPNPVSDWLTVEISATVPNDLTLRIYDISGRKLVENLQSLKVGNNSFEVDASAYPTGIYLLYLQNEEGFVVERFVVE